MAREPGRERHVTAWRRNWKAAPRLLLRPIIAFALALVVGIACLTSTAHAMTREEARAFVERGLSVGGSSLMGADALLHFDEVSCGLLIIEVDLKLKEIARAVASDQEGAVAKYKTLSDYRERLISACMEDHPAAAPPPPPPPPPPQIPPNGPGAFQPRENWTIEDEICARFCHDAYVAYDEAVRAAQTADAKAVQFSKLAQDESAAAAAAEKALAQAEADRAQARGVLTTPIIGVPTAAQQSAINNANVVMKRDLTPLREAAAKAKADAAQAAKWAAQYAAAARAADDKAVEARAAYRLCTKKCQNQAHLASPGAEQKTAGAPTTSSGSVLQGGVLQGVGATAPATAQPNTTGEATEPDQPPSQHEGKEPK